jgi:hypothetical protein
MSAHEPMLLCSHGGESLFNGLYAWLIGCEEQEMLLAFESKALVALTTDVVGTMGNNLASIGTFEGLARDTGEMVWL